MTLVATALLLPAAARAAPPTLDSVTESATPGILEASWTLPSGMSSYYVDVGTSPRTDTIGAFKLGVLLDLFGPSSTTTWQASGELPPATYYVHVAALDLATCNPDCVEEFSNVVEVTIAGTPVPPAHPPVLGVVSQANRHLTANWTLALSENADFIEVARSSDAYAGGGFRVENSVLFEPLGGTDTSFTSSRQLPAGTYYVHVAGTDDANCPIGIEAACFIDEYSTTKAITIVDTGPPPVPVLQSVGQEARHLTASWTLPTGLEYDFIEAATDPTVDVDGYFLTDKTVLFDLGLDASQTTYRSPDQLPPGTYYVHVGAFDTTCPGCPEAFSDVLAVTILPATSAGGGRSAVPGLSKQTKPAPVTADRTTAFRVLVAASKQDVDKLFVLTSMAEAGTVTAGGAVSVPNLSKVYRFKTVSSSAAPGASVRLKLKLPKRALKAVKQALRRHRKVKAKLTITAKDKAGNKRTERRTVSLKP